MRKKKNTFVEFLDLMGVKHTQSFSEQYFSEHPHKYNLFGISKMLENYGIENAVTQITDKLNDITEIQTPFFAQFRGDIVTVYKVEHENISFLWNGVSHLLEVTKFIESWTGIVLAAESSEKSIEPNYKKHRIKECIIILKRIMFFCACGILTVLAYIYQSHYNNEGISILLLINFAGLYVSWLLLLKQMHIESQYADKICSLIKQNDCINILESDAAKLWGVIGWSEIGFGYFLSNVFILLFSPVLITHIALINILTLPYAFWSIWYQKLKAKQWCVLCLIVQVLLWAIFIIDYLCGFIRIPELNLHEMCLMIVVGSCYIILIFGINMLVPNMSSEKSTQTLQQSINSIKADEKFFTTLLKQQPFYETNDCHSIIQFGNSNSKLRLTVLSNPYCNPCAKMHKRIAALLKQANNTISVQYILSSFGENLNSTNKYLIASCLDDKAGSIIHVLNDWFEKGKEQKDDFFSNFSLDMDNPEIEIEFQKYKAWKTKTGLQTTPTLLVNGYLLPESYKVEDLLYFNNCDL